MSPGRQAGGLLRWAGKSLQRQLALISAGLILLASALFLVFVTTQFRSHILAAHEEASLNVNLLLQAALENAMIKRDLAGLQDVVKRLGAQDNVAGVMIASPRGEIRFSSYRGRMFQQVGDDGFDRAVATGEKFTGFRVLESGEEVLRSINPVHNQPRCGECHGPVEDHPINGLLIVDYDASSVRATVRHGALLLAGLGVAVLLLLELGLWFAVHRFVLAPLTTLSATTEAIAAGDLTQRNRNRGADELARLGTSFDDMADRLEAHMKEVEQAHAALQTLIDAIPDGVRVIDADFRIVMANSAYRKQIGAAPGTLVGQPCHLSSHGRDKPCVPTLVTCPVEEILRRGAGEGQREEPRQGQGALTCSHVHRDREGAEFSVEVSAAPVTLRIAGEDRRCVVESIRDLETDMSISQKQRLAEMGSLAAGVAHEVNNPLSSISLVLKSVKSQEALSEQAVENIAIAETEIGNCRAITESLLRLTALPQIEPELVDLGTVIRDTARLLSFEADQAGVAIEIEQEGQPRVIARDSDMRNLVFNLALNAIHAMPGGGVLRIASRESGAWVRFEVEDNGVGIPERDQPKILLPFWTRRADGSRGRGLGLAICSSVVKALGGTLRFKSTPGKGTCFTIDLPNAGGEGP